jgi:hypothetical protein
LWIVGNFSLSTIEEIRGGDAAGAPPQPRARPEGRLVDEGGGGEAEAHGRDRTTAQRGKEPRRKMREGVVGPIPLGDDFFCAWHPDLVDASSRYRND